MSKVGNWSTTAGNNNAVPPDGWPEGQAASTVNDCAREMMAAIRTLASDAQYIDLGHTPSFKTATTFSLGTADVANFEVGRRLKLFDSTTLYGTINSVSGTFVSVRLDAGALTTSLSSVALGIIHNTSPALPEAAYTQQNVIINGDLDIWQRGTFFGNPQNFDYTADRFMFEGNMTGNVNVLQKPQSASADQVPTVAQAGRYINNSLAIAVSATQTTLLSNSYAMLSYIVEGFDWRPVAHQPLGLGFWVNANKSGIYSVVIRNALVSAAYVTCFTVTAVNVMTHFFLQLPEAPAAPYTWDYGNGAGLRISWVLAAGTSQQVTNPYSWTAANLIAVPGQVNLYDTPFNQFAITGVTLKRGWADVPLSTRRYAEELALCQRYYWKGLPAIGLNTNSVANGAISSWTVKFPVTMRTTPSVSASVVNTTWNFLDPFTATYDAPTPDGARLLVIATAEGTNNNLLFGNGDYFMAEAEL